MALSVTFNRTDNSFRISAETGDTGKLRIQYNQSDIYNNLSGSVNDISAGAETSIYIPLNSNKKIPKGVYRFDFDAATGSSYDVACDFQIDDIEAKITHTVDTLAPSFKVEDDTVYTIANGTISSATRTLTTEYPKGTSESDLVASASDITTDLYNNTSVLYEGVMQTTLTTSLTYTIAATTGFPVQSGVTRQGFTYVADPSGYAYSPQLADYSLSNLYTCIESLRTKLEAAKNNDRDTYNRLKTDYAYATGLLSQYKEAIYTNNSSDVLDLVEAIEDATDCTLTTSTTTSGVPQRIYGLGLATIVDDVVKVRKVLSSSQMASLDSVPVKILDTDSSYFYTPIGASIACKTAPSGTPSTTLVVKIHQGSTYDADKSYMTCTLPSTLTTAGDYANFSQENGKELVQSGGNIYIGAAASASDWDGEYIVTFFYGLTKS